MSKFESMFRLWLCGFGVNEADTDKICQNRRMVANFARKDSGAVIQDLHRVLYETHVRNDGMEKAFDTPYEKLLLISLLDRA